MATIDERIVDLERDIDCPGTMITRVLKPHVPGRSVNGVWRPPEKSELRWCVAIGAMEMPKRFYYGDTIEEAIRAAEKRPESPTGPGGMVEVKDTTPRHRTRGGVGVVGRVMRRGELTKRLSRAAEREVKP